MDNTQEQNIINYTTPPLSLMVTGGAFALFSPILYLIFLSFSSDKLLPIVVASVTAIMGIVMFCMRFFFTVRVKGAINKARGEGMDGKIASDFINGEKYLHGTMIVGEVYVFCKGMGTLVSCREITKVERKQNYYKGVPTSENIRVKLLDGKTVTLCGVNYIQDDSSDADDAIRAIERRCPNIVNR